MKTISSTLAAAMAGETVTLCTCWKLTRADGTILGFTDLDTNVTFESVTYQAATGFLPSAVQSSADLSVDNLDVVGVIDDSIIKEEDIHAGRYDLAEVEVFRVNYSDLSQGKLVIKRGWIGEITVKGGKFIAEIRGLAQKLEHNIGQLYSPFCRARFCDSKCKLDIEDFTETGSVTSVTSQQVFKDTSRSEVNGYFSGGLITFTSGSNDGLSMEIKEFSGKQFTLVLPMPFAVSSGDSYSAVAGCDKSFDSCVNKFNNAINFHGEPHVPGSDKAFETAGTRSNL